MPAPSGIDPETKRLTLLIFTGPGGAKAAATFAGVTRRTIQRWALEEGVTCGWQQHEKVHGPEEDDQS